MMTKDKVLGHLKREDDFLSGEEISLRLGVSRAAVNQAVKQLRSEGYKIVSVTNKGYSLVWGPDRVGLGELMAALSEERCASILVEEILDSTNSQLRQLAVEGAPAGTVVLAEQQRKGRGRMGRSFFSPPGRGIYFSYLLRPEGDPGTIAGLTGCVAVAARRAVASVCGSAPGIKWVNDLYVHERKVAGVLTELSVEGESGAVQFVVVGIGLNVNGRRDELPEEIREIASTLEEEHSRPWSRAALVAALVREMDTLAEALCCGGEGWMAALQGYLAEYREADVVCGKRVQVIGGNTSRLGEAVEIGDDFALRVRFDDGGEEWVRTGEISVRPVDA